MLKLSVEEMKAMSKKEIVAHASQLASEREVFVRLYVSQLSKMPKKDLVQQVVDTQNEIDRLRALKQSIIGHRGGIE